MAEYIEREAQIEELERIYHAHYVKAREQSIHDVFKAVFKRLSNAPAADVAEVKHGQWMPCGFGKEIMCSVCRCELGDVWEYRYCPDCGAKMDGERRESDDN